jgi:lysophospholipase L1-like esterase
MLFAFVGHWANERSTGLHLTADGYRIVYEEVLKTIRANWPDQDPGVLPMVFPPWGEAPR